MLFKRLNEEDKEKVFSRVQMLCDDSFETQFSRNASINKDEDDSMQIEEESVKIKGWDSNKTEITNAADNNEDKES